MDDDERYIRRAIDLSREAIEEGNTPFGSLLVVDGSVVRKAKNTTVTENDIAAHPEFKLARWASRELEPGERTAYTMYTSAEPCPMCATGIYYAGLGRVVYSVPGRDLANLRDEGGIDIPCREIINRGGGRTVVDGPVLKSEGRQVHEEFF